MIPERPRGNGRVGRSRNMFSGKSLVVGARFSSTLDLTGAHSSSVGSFQFVPQ